MNTDTTMQVTPVGSGGFGGFGDGSWFIIILFLFAFLGWGNGGWGNGGGGVQENYVLTSDFAQMERKLDGINNGLCSGFYQEAQLINGVNQNMASGFATAELSKATQQAALMQTLSAMQAQAADCCCKTQTAIADVKYGAAINTRDVIENQNANTRAILDKMSAQELAAKDQRIADLTQRLNWAELTASQTAQNQYLVSQLGYQCPKPAYVVQPPQAVTFPNGNGCGCGFNA